MITVKKNPQFLLNPPNDVFFIDKQIIFIYSAPSNEYEQDTKDLAEEMCRLGIKNS